MKTETQPVIDKATIQKLASLFPKVMIRSKDGEWAVDTNVLTNVELGLSKQAAIHLGVSVEEALAMAFDASGGILPGETKPCVKLRPPVIGQAMAAECSDNLSPLDLSVEQYSTLGGECFRRGVDFGSVVSEALAGYAAILKAREA